ncbi:MAG TPA: SDR family NAD(P)-dependent oxidoreductase [Candidatus Acidoferrales bacterium]|nr:SDR family NAD(P)-dependent oxidoreductase [Candidatus Acidoferrales bacterium]
MLNLSRNGWGGRRVLVTGGASFIGSHLADALVALGARVRVVDNLTSGRLENLAQHLSNGAVEFLQADLREPGVTRAATQGVDVVFHLAADHGGRGYVDLHQAGPASNLFLDGLVFAEALRAGVGKVVFASSGCVYPNCLQTNPDQELYLTEDLVRPPHDADNMYGWAKLMGELTLQAYHREHGLASASCRYFTVYGPRGVENHAVIAMIARAFVGRDPFEVWGDGMQIRNWTYIDDIVSGTIRAAEKIDDATPVNLGTMERIRVIDAARAVLEYTGHKAQIRLLRNMPTGPRNRVADNHLAKRLLDWEPKTPFYQGLRRTIDWYYSTKNREQVAAILDQMLTER